MTGFGRDIFSNDEFTLETEIKSLNSRFLDISLKMPRELYTYEFPIRDILKNNIKRGKVSLTITLTLNKLSDTSILFNQEDFEVTLQILKKIKELGNFNNEISISNLLSLKDNFLNQKREDIEFDFKIIETNIKKAIENLTEMRLTEGKELEKDLTSRIDNIGKTVKEIEILAESATKDYFEKFKTRADKLLENIINNEDRLIQELAILTEKHDVTEECVRLKSHIKLFNETIKSSEDTGRKLNFICQEMNREANTINSKSISTEISHKGLLIKEELEKIREQVQNIE
jgi:uncharacterized protein (TIGR00255 family)